MVANYPHRWSAARRALMAGVDNFSVVLSLQESGWTKGQILTLLRDVSAAQAGNRQAVGSLI